MSPDKSLQNLFNAALERSDAAERARFLDEACGADAALRERVEKLLRAQEEVGAFMAQPSRKPAGLDLNPTARVVIPLTEKPGDNIGRYKLLQQIGEGGCGVVYMAEQEEPVRRRVALKVIKLGMDTKQVIARFEAERQALALMDHPNIAKVLDAGATETGRPYFVMELVRGVKITEFCDESKLSTEDRLKLFIQVCQAIQHAHQKGVIHRDIKPSNILVTINDGVPVPKVIDFGIAKATVGRLTDQTLFTAFEQFIGTPAYMSPEQAVMTSLDIDTRSDIYSLGVLLYELLTGSPPFDQKELLAAGLDEMRRIIRETEPQRPSNRLSTMAAAALTTTAHHRHTEPPRLVHLVRGDLDWIAMKCLEKDRARRYETTNGLAADIQRHLSCEPVVARPPSRLYEFQKSVRRHKFGFAAAAALILVLAIGVLVSTWQAVRATRAEKRSAAALDELRATAPAFAEQARALAAKEHFAEAIEKLDYAVKLRPDAPEYLVAKGDLLMCQLKLAEAATNYRAALAIQPGHARAKSSAALCEEVLVAPANADGKLTRESLARLHLVMQQQQRPAAELMPVARLLVEEKKLLVDYWLARLKGLPVSAEQPLEKRLTVRDDGLLALDLNDTKVIDLSPLAGAPLAALNVSGCTELADLSPLRGINLIELNISATSVADLAPLSEMHTLEKLNVAGCKVADLAALSGLRLRVLNFQGCPVNDLSPIRKMPLEEMVLRGTRVADLSPLIGMPIKSLDLSMAPVLDFSPLAHLPLEKCYLQRNRITDLAVLRDKPLKELVLWGCVDARNYAAITGIKTLELLLLPSEYRDLPAEDRAAIGSLRDHPRLRQLGADIMNQMGYTATGSKDVFWQDWDREQSLVIGLQEQRVQFSLSKLPAGTYRLSIESQPLRDLAILKGVPISELILDGCPFSDLAPIHELKLEHLELTSSSVADLGPLRETPLKKLYLSGPMITDLSPLKDLPLRELYLDGCENLTDVAALAEIPTLEQVTVPMQARNIEALHKLARLQMLGFNRIGNPLMPASTVADFWKEYAANDWIIHLRNLAFNARTLQRLEDGTWEVNLQGTAIDDLTILHGAPISSLRLGNTAVSDLTPLRGMALKFLQLYHTKVTDLRPLEGMPLRYLHVSGTSVTNLLALSGMPLTSLRLHDCAKLTDLSPLADCRELKHLTLPPNAENFEFLRNLSKLERISFKEDSGSGWRPDKTAAEFWKEYDARKK